MGKWALVGITPLLTSKEPFCACVVGKVSWLREWGICGLLPSIWEGPSLLSQLSCYSHLPSSGPQGTNSNRLPWGPICLLPQEVSLSETGDQNLRQVLELRSALSTVVGSMKVGDICQELGPQERDELCRRYHRRQRADTLASSTASHRCLEMYFPQIQNRVGE